MIDWRTSRNQMSGVALLGYDATTPALYVLWRAPDGNPTPFAYRYRGVPQDLFDMVVTSNAPGRAIHAHVIGPSDGGLAVYASACEAVYEGFGPAPARTLTPPSGPPISLAGLSIEEPDWHPLCSDYHAWLVLEGARLWHIDLVGGQTTLLGQLT